MNNLDPYMMLAEVGQALESAEANGYKRAREAMGEERRVLMREILAQMRTRNTRSISIEELYILFPKETA